MTDRARVLFYDIEATDLEASFGHVLCVGYAYLDKPGVKVLALRDFPRPKKTEEPDARLMKRVHKILMDESDVIVSFYGKEYDRKFLNTRMLMTGLPPLPPLNAEHIDLYFTARGNLKLHSNRLQAVSESLGCPMSKTPVRADTWRKAQRGDPEAIQYVVNHCKRDVAILKWVYLKLRPFVRQHPPVTTNLAACRACGATRWLSNGFRFRLGERQRRMQCQECGRWSYIDAKGRLS